MPDDINKNRFSLWGIDARTMAVGGAGIGLYRSRNDISSFLKAGINTGNVERTVANLNTIGRFKTTNTLVSNSSINSTFESMLMGYQKTSSLDVLKNSIRRSAFESLMAPGTMGQREALKALNVIGEQTSAISAYKTAMDVINKFGGDINVLESNVTRLGKGGVFSPSVLSSMSHAVMSPGNMGTIMAEDIGFSSLPVEARERASSIIGAFRKASDNKFDIDIPTYRTIEENFGGKIIKTPMMKVNIGGSRLNIPLLSTGMTYEGQGLTARYLTRQNFLESNKLTNYTDIYTRNIEEAIAGSKTPLQLSRNIKRAQEVLAGNKVWTLPPELMTSGGLAKARLTQAEALGYKIPQSNIESFIGKGLYPYVSPTPGAKGVLTTKNIVEEMYGSVGKLMGAELRPTQPIRGEWGVTEAAKRNVRKFGGIFGEYYDPLEWKVRGSEYNNLILGGENIASGKAYTAPQLMTFYAKPLEEGYNAGYQRRELNKFLSLEEGVIAEEATKAMEYERVVQKKVTLAKGLEINDELLALKNQPLGGGITRFSRDIGAAGEFIGIEADTGRELWGKGPKSKAIGAELVEEDLANIYFKETETLGSKEPWKLFGLDVKSMVTSKDRKQFKQYLKATGALESGVFSQSDIEAILSGGVIAKNKTALFIQQSEAINYLLSKKINTGKILLNREAEKFLADPMKAIGSNGILEKTINRSEAEFLLQKRLIQKAKKFGFTPEEMSATFGLMKQNVVEEFGRTGVLTTAEQKAIISSGGVWGLSKGMLGDLATEGGVGRRGSFEASGFRLLSMKGAEGERFAAELATRIKDKQQFGALERMEASLIGQESIFNKVKQISGIGISTKDITGLKNFVQEEGYYLNLGRKFKSLGGSSSIYIPGTKEAAPIMAPSLSKGELVSSPIEREIKNLRGLISTGASEEVLEEAATNIRKSGIQAIESQMAPRGKILGTKYLTGTASVIPQQGDDIYRVSSKTAQSMYEDLIGRATTQEQLTTLEAELESLKRGEDVWGGIWRHPTTGPESFQFVRYKIDSRIADGMIHAPRNFGKIQFQGGNEIPIDISGVTGMKGDFDKDAYTLAAISDRDVLTRLKKKGAKGIREEYTDYLFNHYAMKDLIERRKPKSISDLGEEGLREGHKKLTTAKLKTGPVNIALQKLKLGMQYAAPKEYRPMAELFFHMEEAAISGKHGIFGEGVYKGVTEAVEGKDVAKMEEVFTSLLGEARDITGSITDLSGGTIQKTYSHDPRRLAEISIGAIESAGQDIESSMRSAALAKGGRYGDVSLNKLAESLYARKVGSVDVSQSLMQKAFGETDMFSTKVNTFLRKGQIKMQGFAKALNKAKAPMLVGGIAAAGIMLAAPSISGSLGGGRKVVDEDLGPPVGLQMNPPPPRQNIAPRIYDIGTRGRTIQKARMRMRINDLDAAFANFMNSVRELSSSGNVKIRTRDDRSILDPRSLASKIHERL